MTETQAIDLCRRGDPAGLRVLFDLHRDKVFRLSWRMLGGPHDAEDAVQEVFLKVFRTVGSYRGDSAFSTWLYRMTANHCLDILRRRKVLSFIGMDKAPEPPSTDDTSVSARRHLSPVVQRALARLPEKQRACLLLCEMEERRYEEIAKIVGISLGSVKSSIHRAKRAMREALEREGMSADDV
jgi:RNA polymerase sigma-70 factor (ECF subfamily)